MKDLTELNKKYNLQELAPRKRYVGGNLTQVGIHFTSEMTSLMRSPERLSIYIDPALSAILVRPCGLEEGFRLTYAGTNRQSSVLANRKLYQKMKAGRYELEDQLEDGTFLLINTGI